MFNFNSPKSQVNRFTNQTPAAHGGAPVQQLFQAYANRQPVRSLTTTGEGQYDYTTPDWARFGDYTIQAKPGVGGTSENPLGYYIHKTLQPGQESEALNGTPFDYYNPNGQFMGSHTWQNVKGESGLDKLVDKAIPILTTMFIGGGLAGAAGAGPMAQPGGFFNPGTAATTGASSGAVGSGAGFIGEGASSGIPGWDAALANSPSWSAGAGGGLSSILKQLGVTNSSGGPNIGSLIRSGLGQILNGGGSGGSGGGSGVGLNDIIGLIGGGVDASRQGAASQAMRDWLMNQQNKMDNYMKPDSPEWNAMWEAMSRKDAAAGRNSQYGPRTTDFLAKVAEAKAANTRQFTTGTSRAYSDALNQNASKYAGLSSAMQRMGAGSNIPINLSSILNSIGGDGSTGGQDLGDVWSGVDAWDEAWANAMNGGEDFIDYGEFF